MKDRIRQARVAALSMAHCTAVAKMLRASGREGHADKLETALNEAARIVSAELGPDALIAARAWVSDEATDTGEMAAPPPLRH